ncbi:hypothetical protein LSCM1_01528 [Leishmania martiniquensis]|uniref:Uncharacterized protein n=1 Tax=Leishmania martiniquensis TaxID=1580590 RepID=A0A836KI03_9TRYP|nr:hypothetical protein LSCM1_01528 [Leishmania martiniquensis]
MASGATADFAATCEVPGDKKKTNMSERSAQSQCASPRLSIFQRWTLVVRRQPPAPRDARKAKPGMHPRWIPNGDRGTNCSAVPPSQAKSASPLAVVALSGPMSGSGEERSSGAHNGAVSSIADGILGSAAIQKRHGSEGGLVRGFRAPARAPGLSTRAAKSLSAMDCESCEAADADRRNDAPLPTTPSCNLRCETSSGSDGGTIPITPANQDTLIVSLARTQAHPACPQVRLAPPQALEKNGEGGGKTLLGQRVMEAVAATSGGGSPFVKKPEEVVEGGVGSRNIRTAAVRQWKCVALAAKKVMEKTLAKASRVPPARMSKIQGAAGLSVRPQGQRPEAFAGGAAQAHRAIFNAEEGTHCISKKGNGGDDGDVSVSDADGKPLLIPNISDLWNDFLSPAASSGSLIAGDAEAASRADVAAHERGEDAFRSARSLSSAVRMRFLSTSHDSTPPSHAAPAPLVEALQPRLPKHAPSKRSGDGYWGRRLHNFAKRSAHAHPGYQRYPHPLVQEQMHRRQIVEQQHQRFFLQRHLQRKTASSPLARRGLSALHESTPTFLRTRYQRVQPERGRAALRDNAKVPWPQPDIYNGPKIRSGQSKAVNFTALTGIRLSDARRVKSPCWRSINAADEKRERVKSGQRR